MKIFAGVVAVSIAAVALVLTAGEKPPEDGQKPAEDPVAQLQGTWVETFKDPQGKSYKFVKMISGKSETYSRYEGETLIHQHTVDFEVKKTENVTIFTFRNLVVTAGPNKGMVQKDPVSYLYQIKGGKLFYVFGVMNNDSQPPSAGMCQRVEEKSVQL